MDKRITEDTMDGETKVDFLEVGTVGEVLGLAGAHLVTVVRHPAVHHIQHLAMEGHPDVEVFSVKDNYAFIFVLHAVL